MSRSRLVSLALAEYLRRRRHKQVLEQLNRVYAERPDAAERRTIRQIKTKFSKTIRERW